MADLKARTSNVDTKKKPIAPKGASSKIAQNLTKQDLLKLLSLLEGELQARDMVILSLKTDKEKLAQAKVKYGQMLVGDPVVALQRDIDNATVPASKNTAAMTTNPMAHLELLMEQHKKAQDKMMKQLKDLETSHAKVVKELEDEKRKHAQDTAQGDDVTYMLEKERERLIQQVDFEKAQQKKLEKDSKRSQNLLKEERIKHQQFAILLVKERKRLATKLIEERQKTRDLTRQLEEERYRIKNMADGLVQESKKSLKMEAAMEKQISEFDIEREQLKAKYHREENRTRDLRKEMEKLKQQVVELENKIRQSERVGGGGGDGKTSVTSISMISSVKNTASKHSATVEHSGETTMTGLRKSQQSPTPNKPLYSTYTPGRVSSPYNVRSSDDEPSKPEVKFTPKSHPGKTGIPVKQENGLQAGKVGTRQSPVPTSPTHSGKKSPLNSRGTPPPVPPNKPILKKDANKNNPTPQSTRAADSLVESRKQFYATKFNSDVDMDNRRLALSNANVNDTDMSNESPASSPDSTASSSGSSTSSVVMNPHHTPTPVVESTWRRHRHDIPTINAPPTPAAGTASDNENRNNPNMTDIEQLLVTMTTGKLQKTTLA